MEFRYALKGSLTRETSQKRQKNQDTVRRRGLDISLRKMKILFFEL